MARASLSIREARAIALVAQRFGAPRKSIGGATLRAMIGNLGALQIDSVNALVRSQYLPAFSRLGPYDRTLLDAVVYSQPRRFFEYWGHEASYLPVELFPAMRWRMERSRTGHGVWKHVARAGRERPDLVERIRERMKAEGPISASQLPDAKHVSRWWGWSETKSAMEFLFWCGEITPIGRHASFERIYDLTERVIPASVYAVGMSEHDALDQLVDRAARAYGAATEADLRDYFRLPLAGARAAISRLVEANVLLPVSVEGWKQGAYLHRDARVPRKAIEQSTFLSPFDSLIWNRERTRRLFGFNYKLEMYTPAPHRVHGYYVLPYLLNGALCARADLKADRAAGVLIAHNIHYEMCLRETDVKPRVRADLDVMAEWLGLDDVYIAPKTSQGTN